MIVIKTEHPITELSWMYRFSIVPEMSVRPVTDDPEDPEDHLRRVLCLLSPYVLL